MWNFHVTTTGVSDDAVNPAACGLLISGPISRYSEGSAEIHARASTLPRRGSSRITATQCVRSICGLHVGNIVRYLFQYIIKRSEVPSSGQVQYINYTPRIPRILYYCTRRTLHDKKKKKKKIGKQNTNPFALRPVKWREACRISQWRGQEKKRKKGLHHGWTALLGSGERRM